MSTHGDVARAILPDSVFIPTPLIDERWPRIVLGARAPPRIMREFHLSTRRPEHQSTACVQNIGRQRTLKTPTVVFSKATGLQLSKM